MKLPSPIFMLILLGLLQTSHAQLPLSLDVDTAYTSALLPASPPTAFIWVYNTDTQSISLDWERVVEHIPNNWQSSFENLLITYPPTTTMHHFDIAAGDSMRTGVFFYHNNEAGTGTVRIRLTEKNNPASDSLLLTFITELSPAVGLLPEAGLAAEVWPNPSPGSLHVQLAERGRAVLELFSTQGERIFSEEEVGEVFEIENLAPGIYFLRIRQGAQSLARKIVVY